MESYDLEWQENRLAEMELARKRLKLFQERAGRSEEGRCIALAVTHLQEAELWLREAIAIQKARGDT